MSDINRNIEQKCCNVAILKNGDFKKLKVGDEVRAKYMSKNNYSEFKACEFTCKGCGCTMRPRLREGRGHFFAPYGHNLVNGKQCAYYHEGNENTPKKNVEYIKEKEVEYAIDSIIDKAFKDKGESKTTGGSGESPKEPKKHKSDEYSDTEKRHKKNINKNLKTIYEECSGKDPTTYIGKYKVGELFIMENTLIAKSITDFNGRHISVGEPINAVNFPSKVNEIINKYGNNVFTFRNEYVPNSSFKPIYFVLTFENYNIKEFIKNFKDKKPDNYNKYGYKCIFISDLSVEYNGNDYMICVGNINNKDCYYFRRYKK